MNGPLGLEGDVCLNHWLKNHVAEPLLRLKKIEGHLGIGAAAFTNN